ncbi:hypothetical protein [Azospirillum sp.]|uniref:hypothetical protein n=1 Tax=Azospirillum sp. TaxID=34012 RepID=UPI003D74469E
MSGRGILYIVWGEALKGLLQRSIQSVKAHHSELPIQVVTLPADLDPYKGLLEKSRMFDLSPFETTLFLDSDTVVLGRLDFGFAQAERYGVACAICECPWAGRYQGLSGDLIEYNTGVLFFARKAKPLFDRWRELAPAIDSSFYHVPPGRKVVGRMDFNDQAGFAKAVDDTGFLPAALPPNWNFRPRWQKSFFGPLKIWHDYDDVPQGVLDANAYYAGTPNAVMQCVTLYTGENQSVQQS